MTQLPYALSQAEIDVLDERRGQRTREGFDAAHDDAHTGFQLSMAAECYLNGAVLSGRYPTVDRAVIVPGGTWPHGFAWRPGTMRRMLVKAAALILAEIDRIDRAEAKP